MDHLEGQPAVPSLVISWQQSKIYIQLGIQSVGVEINFLCPHRGLHDIQQMGVPFYMCVQFLSCVWLFASLPDSSVQGILQARILEQVIILSRKWKWKWSCSVMFDCFDPMDYVAHKAPPPMEFSRQEYWSGFPFPSPGDLPDPQILSRGSSQPRDQTHLCISCIDRQIFLQLMPPGKPIPFYRTGDMGGVWNIKIKTRIQFKQPAMISLCWPRWVG